MTIDTPRLNEVERKIAEGLTVSPREMYDLDKEFLTLALYYCTQQIQQQKFSLIEYLKNLVWSSVCQAKIAFYSNSLGRETVIGFYLQHQDDKSLQEVAESRSKMYRSFITNREGQGKLDAN